MMKKGRNDNKILLIAVVLVCITSIAYLPVFSNGFIQFFDDGSYILRNTNVQQGLTGESIEWALTTTYNANWHPLTWLSHMLDFEMYGLDARGHHATNLLFHIADAVLLFLLLNRLTRSQWRSALVAALFAVHPLHVESVAWAAERKDVLSMFFWILTSWAYVRYTECTSVKRYLAVTGLFVLGLMSKPMLVTLPLVLLMLDYWPLSRLTSGARLNRRVVLEKLPLFALSAASCLVTYFAQQRGGAMEAVKTYTFGIRAANAVVGYVAYLVKAVCPIKLALLYPHPGPSLPLWEVIGAAVALIAITVLVIRAGKKRPYLAFGWLWYMVTLIPVIGFVQVGTQAIADRYTYVPLIGIFVAAVWGVWEIVEDKKPRSKDSRTPSLRFAIPAALILLVLSTLTWIQVGYWKDDLTLFQHSADVTRDNYTMHGNLGSVYVVLGDTEKALLHLGKAVEMRPDIADLHSSYGHALFMAGKVDEAVKQLSEAVRLDPNLPEMVHQELAQARDKQKGMRGMDPAKYERAVALFNEAVVLDNEKTANQAAEMYKEAIRLAPNYADPYVNLARWMYNQGDTQSAVELCTRAVKLKPDFGFAHNSLAIYLFVSNDFAGSWREAHLAEKYGTPPAEDFLQMLAGRMPDPGQ